MTTSPRTLAKLLAPVAFGLITYLLPWLIWGAASPEGLSPKAWLYFSIFLVLPWAWFSNQYRPHFSVSSPLFCPFFLKWAPPVQDKSTKW